MPRRSAKVLRKISKMDEHHNITLQLEGLQSEEGHVLLADLVDELRLLEQSLNRIDRIVDEKGETALAYRVVQATHSSPLCFVLEPIVKRKVSNPHQRVQATHARFFKELGAIEKGIPPSNDIDNNTLELLRRMVTKPAIQKLTIKNGTKEVKLDKSFERNLDRLLRIQDYSTGTLTGKLEALNIHGKTNLFWLYPAIGPERVLCHFQSGNKEKIKSAIDKYVEARGVKIFRVNCPFPYRMNVLDFNVLLDQQEESMIDLRGMAKETHAAADSVELINRARDEWD